jgi:hypothetical protein
MPAAIAGDMRSVYGCGRSCRGEVERQPVNVVVEPIMTASPIASAGRFSPRGPLGILNPQPESGGYQEQEQSILGARAIMENVPARAITPAQIKYGARWSTTGLAADWYISPCAK